MFPYSEQVQDIELYGDLDASELIQANEMIFMNFDMQNELIQTYSNSSGFNEILVH